MKKKIEIKNRNGEIVLEFEGNVDSIGGQTFLPYAPKLMVLIQLDMENKEDRKIIQTLKHWASVVHRRRKRKDEVSGNIDVFSFEDGVVRRRHHCCGAFPLSFCDSVDEGGVIHNLKMEFNCDFIQTEIF